MVQQLLDACNRLGDSVVSVILFGSIARGDVYPGSSDVLDAIVILRDEVFHDSAEYRRVLQVFVEACRVMRSSGLPFHPFLYYFESEFPRYFERLFQPLLRSNKLSQVLAGVDARCWAQVNLQPGEYDKLVFFGLRRTMQRALSLSDRGDSTVIQNTVKWFLKSILTAVTMAGDVPASYPESIESVRRMFPALDSEALDRLIRFQREERVTDAAAKQAICDALQLTETFNFALQGHLAEAGKWNEAMACFDAAPGPA